MKTKEGRKVTIYIEQPKTPAERLKGKVRYKKVLEILAEGMFEYIIENGYLNEDKKEKKETASQ